MKKSLLALAVLSAIAGSAAAQTNVTIYGVADAGFVSDDNGTARKNSIDSGIQSGSRIGFRGTEDLGSGLKALFTLETGINIDTGGFSEGGKAFGRQSFVGLQGEFGTVKLGRQDTLLREAQLLADPFGIGLVSSSTAFFTQGGGFLPGGSTQGRADNSIKFESADYTGFSAKALYGFGEKRGDNAPGREYSASVKYANGPLAAVLAYDASQQPGPNYTRKTTIVGGTYDFGVAKLHLMADTTRNVPRTVDERDYLIGATVPFGASTFLVDFIKKTDRSGNSAGAKQYAVGYTYAISKRTNLYTAYSQTKNDAGSAIRTLDAASPTLGFGNTDKVFTAGVRHLF